MSRTLSGRMTGMEKTLIRRINDLADPSCINLGLGELRFPTPKAVLDHVRENMGAWRLGYSPNEGFPELLELIAARAGGGTSPGQVCVTVGAEEALQAALMVLVDAGDEVLVPDPGFPAYPSLVRLAGGVPKPYPLLPENGFGLRADALLSLVSDKTRAVIVNSPNNPTGAVHSPGELRELARGLRSHPLTVISDEVYRDIVFGEPAAPLSGFFDRLVTVDSLSKSHSMSGWRVGWCLAPPDIAKAVRTFHQLAVMCVPSLSQYAAIHALRGAAAGELRSNMEELRRRRDLAVSCVERFAGFPCAAPAGTFYLFVDISSVLPKFGTSLDAAMKLLAEEKVVTIPGSAFGRVGERYLRISFAPEPGALEEGIRRMGRFFRA